MEDKKELVKDLKYQLALAKKERQKQAKLVELLKITLQQEEAIHKELKQKEKLLSAECYCQSNFLNIL